MHTVRSCGKHLSALKLLLQNLRSQSHALHVQLLVVPLLLGTQRVAQKPLCRMHTNIRVTTCLHGSGHPLCCVHTKIPKTICMEAVIRHTESGHPLCCVHTKIPKTI